MLGPMEGMPAPMYLAFLHYQDQDIRRQNKEARKRSRTR